MSASQAAGSRRQTQGSSRAVAWLRDHWISIVTALVLSWIVVVPLVYLIIFSFQSGTAAAPGDWTLQNYITVYARKLPTGLTEVDLVTSGG